MANKPLTDYKDRCGGCKYFAFKTKKDSVFRYGPCELAKNSYYKQASQTKCMKYEDYPQDD